MEYETKYVFDDYHSAAVKQQLNHLCKHDSQFAKNTIHSVYFDTPNWSSAMGKAASDYLKTKLRIRWYTPADSTDTALKPSGRFLEVKHKIGSTRQKHRLSLSEQFETFNAKQPSLTSKQREELRHALQQIEPVLLAMQLDPSLTVSYQRQRYYDPFSQTRIALDSNIVCQSASRQLTMANSRIKLDKAVLETKGTQRRLPTCLRGAGLAMIEKTAFSKYYESYKLLSHYEQ